jgi:Zn-dependent protease with chaperone function
MADQTEAATPPVEQQTGIQAVVEPIKAVGGLLGFGIGFLASHRSGADLTTAALHGLVGAALLFLLAWYVALMLVRELMKQHVDEQRRLYAERVQELHARAGQSGAQTPDGVAALAKTMPQAVLGPPR